MKPGLPSLVANPEQAGALWRALRKEFPAVYACALMPDHLHIFPAKGDRKRQAFRLSVVLRAWTRKYYPGREVWEVIHVEPVVASKLHIRRVIKYIHLNPCRDGLVPDPLCWRWSTHQDYSGSVAEPWPDLDGVAGWFGCTRARLGAVAHLYISTDASVSHTGTPPLAEYVEGLPIHAGLPQIVRASAIAVRASFPLRRGPLRRLAIQMSARLRLRPAPAAFKIHRATWFRELARPRNPLGERAVLRILADSRPLKGP